jgi:hypothetical protein
MSSSVEPRDTSNKPIVHGISIPMLKIKEHETSGIENDDGLGIRRHTLWGARTVP